jgi:hypothetical protein
VRELSGRSALAGLFFYKGKLKMKLINTSKILFALATGAVISFGAPVIVNAQTPAPTAAQAKAAPAAAPAASAKVDAPAKADKAPAKADAAPADKPKKAKKKTKKAKKDATPAK